MWPVSGASKPVLSFKNPAGRWCCVSAKHRVVVVSCSKDDKLYVFDLDSGQQLRTLGLGTGSGPGQLHCGIGLCFGFSGDTIMVADHFNNRVSELALADGAYVTHHGHGSLDSPQWVDCDPGTQTLLVTSQKSVTLFYVRTGRTQPIATPVGRWGAMMPARYCGGNGQSVLVHSVDSAISSHIRRMSLSGEELESEKVVSVYIINDVVRDADTDTGPMGTLIVACENELVGPLKAVQSEDRSTCWHAGGLESHLAPLRDGSGTLVVFERNSVHVLRNPERDLRWAWITAAAVAFAWFSNVQNAT